jgi:hypothetical protein
MKKDIAWRKIFPVAGRAYLLTLCLLLMAPAAQAANEVSGINFNQAVTGDQFVRVTEPLTFSWTAPTDTTNVIKYIYKFDTVNTALSDLAFSDATKDGDVDKLLTNWTLDPSFFNAFDSDKVRYVHIKTWYATDSGPAYSTDVISDAVKIDNVAPSGSIQLDPASGSSALVNVTLVPSDPGQVTYWVNDAATFPGGAGSQYSSLFPQIVLQLSQNSIATSGDKTIYAWFQDTAGNRASPYTTSAVYAYTGIVYTSSSIIVGANLGFTVDDTTPYDWTITPFVAGVASITGGDTTTTKLGAASITVNGLKAGTFTVSATPVGGGTTLTSGTIKVVQTYKLGDVDGNDVINVFDVIKIARASLGLSNTGTFIAAAADIDNNSVINVFDVIKAARLSLGLSI